MTAYTSLATIPKGATASMRGRRSVDRGVSASAPTSPAPHDAAAVTGIDNATP